MTIKRFILYTFFILLFFNTDISAAKKKYKRYKPSTYSLIRKLHNTFSNIRAYGAQQLGEHNEDKEWVIANLAAALADKEQRVRQSAYQSMVKHNEKELADAVRNSFMTYKDDKLLSLHDKRIFNILRIIINYPRAYHVKPESHPFSVNTLVKFLTKKNDIEKFDLPDNELKDEIIQTTRTITYAYEKLSRYKHTNSYNEKKDNLSKAIINLGETAYHELIITYKIDDFSPEVKQILTKHIRNNVSKYEPVFLREVCKPGFSYKREKKAVQAVKILKSIISKELTDTILQKIKNGRIKPNKHLVQLLGSLPTPEVRAYFVSFLQNVVNSGSKIQSAADIIYEVGKLGDEENTPLLISLLNNSNRSNRIAAANALANMDDTQSSSALIRRLKIEKDNMVIAEIFKVFGYRQNRKAIPSIIKKYNQIKYSTILKNAFCTAFIYMPDKRAIKVIEKMPKQSYFYTRYKNPDLKITALALCGKSAIYKLTKIATSKENDYSIRQDAVRALGLTHSRKAVPVLMKIFNGNDYKIQNVAACALMELAHTDILKYNDLYTGKTFQAQKIIIGIGKKAIPYLNKYITTSKNKKGKETAVKAYYDIYKAYEYYNKGTQYLHSKYYSNAIAWLNKAISLHPSFYPAMNNLAVCYYFTGNYSEALKYFKKVAFFYDPEKAQAEMNLGATYQKIGKPIMARIHTLRSIKLKKNYASARYNNGWIHDDTWRLSVAEQDLQTAIKLDKNHIKAMITRALVLANQGKKSEAISILKTAEGHISPEDKDLYDTIQYNKTLLLEQNK